MDFTEDDNGRSIYMPHSKERTRKRHWLESASAECVARVDAMTTAIVAAPREQLHRMGVEAGQ